MNPWLGWHSSKRGNGQAHPGCECCLLKECVAWMEYKEQKAGRLQLTTSLPLPSPSLLCHLLLCDVPLSCHLASESADYKLKRLQSVSQINFFLTLSFRHFVLGMMQVTKTKTFRMFEGELQK